MISICPYCDSRQLFISDSETFLCACCLKHFPAVDALEKEGESNTEPEGISVPIQVLFSDIIKRIEKLEKQVEDLVS